MSDEIEQLRTEVARQRQRRIDATMALFAADALANTLRALVAEQHDEIERLRAALRLACVEVFGFCDPLATSPDELAESYIDEARNA